MGDASLYSNIDAHDSYRLVDFWVEQKPSLQQIVLQVSAAIGQLIAAKKLTDAVMTMLMKEKRHYNDLKIVQSKDFND